MHLLRHDVVAHRGLLLAWAAAVAAPHVMAATGVTTVAGMNPGFLHEVVLPFLRVLLLGVALAAAIQADSPVDDRAFWRTRPIAPGTMATGKLLLAWTAGVVVPLALVMVLAARLELPWHHWPSTIAQVVSVEGALVGVLIVVGTRTTSIPGLLIATVCLLVVSFLLMGALQQLRYVPRLRELDLLADPQVATWAMLAWAALACVGLFALGYRGRRHHTAFLAALLATVSVVPALWFSPVLRAARPAPLPVTLTVGAEVHAEAIARPEAKVALLAHAVVHGLTPLDRVQVFLLDGTLATRSGEQAARGDRDPRIVTSMPRYALLGVLEATEFARSSGQRARFVGRFNVDVERRQVVASVPLVAGAALDTPHTRFTVEHVGHVEDDRGRHLSVTGQELLLWTPGQWRPAYQYVLRDAAGSCEVPAVPHGRTDVLEPVLATTFARPFLPMRFTAKAQPADCALDPTRTVLEIRRSFSPPPTAVPVTLEFTMPTATHPPRT